MRISWERGPFHISFSVSWGQRAVGVNSLLKQGGHYLMWDFDGEPLSAVIHALRQVQGQFGLPNIVILQSSPGDHYHAYAWHEVTLPEFFYIVGSTAGVDNAFLTIGALRGFWTLRISPRNGFEPSLICELPSDVEDDCSPDDVAYVCDYYSNRAPLPGV